jgi:hypothetical protein
MPRWSMVPRPNLVCWKYLAETHNAETAGAVAGIGSQRAQPLHNCTAVAATQRWRERIPRGEIEKDFVESAASSGGVGAANLNKDGAAAKSSRHCARKAGIPFRCPTTCCRHHLHDLVRHDRKRIQDVRPERLQHRHVTGIPAARDREAADTRLVVARIVSVPRTVQVDLEPGVEIHGRRIEGHADVAEVSVAGTTGEVRRATRR